MKMTREEWEAEGRKRFGDDQTKWQFVCPTCDNVMSIERTRTEFTEHLPKLREGKYHVEQECIGRHLPGVGCNWAAYGLFSGPVFVDGIPAFDFAPAAAAPAEGG